MLAPPIKLLGGGGLPPPLPTPMSLGTLETLMHEKPCLIPISILVVVGLTGRHVGSK